MSTDSFDAAWDHIRAGQWAEAKAMAVEILRLQPTHAGATQILGMAAAARHDRKSAVEFFRKAVELDPTDPAGLRNLAQALTLCGDYVAAANAWEKLVDLQPNKPRWHSEWATALLRLGQLERGWPHLRWRHVNNPPREGITQAMWDGSPLNGRTLLIWNDQGLGDAIQFARYVPLIAGGPIALAVQPAVRPLMKQIERVWKLVDSSRDLPACDLQIALMDLPAAMGTTLENIPRNVPYLKAQEAKVAQWRGRLDGERKVHLRVGIAWAGNPKHPNDSRRSVPVRHLQALAKLNEIAFYSLQKSTDLEVPWITNWTADLHDFSDTAALVENLDLVISADTAVGHLAGALGKPVWLLLPEPAEWRWMAQRDDSPWYPTMRLFRQSTSGDWAGVIHRVLDALAQALGDGTEPAVP